MIKAFKEIGLKKSVKFLLSVFIKAGFNLMPLPNFKTFYLKLFGVKIGQNSIIHQIKFINLYRKGFKGLKIGRSCFLADDVLLDLADEIILEDNVTLSCRVNIITHTNVGYKDHPLQKHFPRFTKPVKLKEGAFVGVNATILPGVTVGEKSFIAAGALVKDDIPSQVLVAGVPAKIIRKL